jgi:hypothetical protein
LSAFIPIPYSLPNLHPAKLFPSTKFARGVIILSVQNALLLQYTITDPQGKMETLKNV